MSNRRLSRWGWASGATAIVIALSATVSPAHATVAQGGVYGSGTINDDWTDEGPLSTSQNSRNSVVGLWQAVLVADGYLPVAESSIDCIFGPNTRAATIRWQADRNLGADGIVGPQTFGRADNELYSSGTEIRYGGSQYTIYRFYRTSSGRWYSVPSPGDSPVYLDYTNSAFCAAF